VKKRYPVKPKKSLVENMQLVLPVIFDDFMSYKEVVVNHPRRKDMLHQMRIAGKPMRYIMEIILYLASEQFRECFEEIKYVIELVGEIHDCDVFIPELNSHLKEIREYNNRVERNQRIPTVSVRSLVKELREKRLKLFAELCKTFERWERGRFREKLLSAILFTLRQRGSPLRFDRDTENAEVLRHDK
jgi:CHAD domain-containing protein